MSLDCAVSPSAELMAPHEDATSLSRDFVIHTGNVRRCNHLQAFVNPTTQQEVVTALKCTMQCWNKYHQNDYVLQKEIIPHPKLMTTEEDLDSDGNPIPPKATPDAVFVKVFVLKDYEPGLVQTAISSVLKALGQSTVDRLVVELKGDDVGQAAVMAAWKDGEELVHEGFVKQLGASMLSLETFSALIAAATAPVSVLEVSEKELCCKDDHPLRAVAKDHSVTLTVNDDHGDVLPKKTFQRIMMKVLRHESTFTPIGEASSPLKSAPSSTSSTGSSEKLKVEWTPVWVARYTVVDNETSVISKTGYAIGGRYLL